MHVFDINVVAVLSLYGFLVLYCSPVLVSQSDHSFDMSIHNHQFLHLHLHTCVYAHYLSRLLLSPACSLKAVGLSLPILHSSLYWCHHHNSCPRTKHIPTGMPLRSTLSKRTTPLHVVQSLTIFRDSPDSLRHCQSMTATNTMPCFLIWAFLYETHPPRKCWAFGKRPRPSW